VTRSPARRIAASAGTALIVALAIFLWPTRLGGSSSLVIVQGDSMSPTYRSGDLLTTRTEPHYEPGDVVVYRIPRGQAGGGDLVVHRLVAVEADGTLVTRGDNRAFPDNFGATTHDIVGSVRHRIPGGGLGLLAVSRWWTLAIVAGAIATVSLWPAAVGSDDPDRVRSWRSPRSAVSRPSTESWSGAAARTRSRPRPS
jgi:signal peptidase